MAKKEIVTAARDVIRSNKGYLTEHETNDGFYPGMSNDDASVAVCNRAIRLWLGGYYLKEPLQIGRWVDHWTQVRTEVKRQLKEKKEEN